jgi:hypothetical protein
VWENNIYVSGEAVLVAYWGVGQDVLARDIFPEKELE